MGDSVIVGNYDFTRLIQCQREEKPISAEALRQLAERSLEYHIRLSFTNGLRQESLEPTITVHVEIDLSYPSERLPCFYLRSDAITRPFLSTLNSRLKEEMAEICVVGELSVCSVLSWIEDRRYEILANVVAENDAQTQISPKKHEAESVSMRYWLVSHHIYRKELIHKIKSLANELSLMGFFLCGKPGVICVEGPETSCVEYWSRLRRNRGNVWKHINCKHTETLASPSEKLFKVFEEVSFKAHGTYGLRNDFHMDMGQFKNYLDELGCDPSIYKVLFGIDA